MPARPEDLRLENVRRALAALDPAPDALLLTDRDNLGYVSGFTGSTAQALVTPQEAVFITDARYSLRALAECPGWRVVETPQGSGGYGEALQAVLKERPALRRLGFEAGHVTVSQREAFGKLAPDVQWVGTTDVVETLRLVKDAGEVEKIRAAVAVAEAAFGSVKALLAPGTREQDFALELEFAMRRAGASAAAFDTIVASGALGAHPHHHAGPRPLAVGDFVTVDWGATVDGYNSDITRTYAIGRAADEQRDIYGIVLEAQQRAIAAVRPGKTGREIDAVARDFITERGYGDAFGHSLGHSLGRSVHDGPGFSVRADTLVTADGCEILTHLPNALEVLG
jgi:Xaa-Pro aminopeptidase